MTVETEKNRMTAYATNGVIEDFDFDFEIYEEDELLVYYTPSGGSPELLVLNSDYTVDVNGSSGGTVSTLGTPLASGELLLVRHLEILQEADYIENDGLPAETVEDSFDKLTMICLQLQEVIERCLSFPLSSSTSGLELPEPEANKVLAWNSAGDGVENRTFASLSFSGGLTDMDDVTIAGAAKYDLLVHDGSIWRNEDRLERLIFETTASLVPLTITRNYTPNNTVIEFMRFQREADEGAAAAGIGLSLDFYCEVAAGGVYKMGDFKWVNTNASYGTPDMEFTINLDMGGGAFKPIFQILGSRCSFHDYDSDKQLILNPAGCTGDDRILTINMGGENRQIDFSQAGEGDMLTITGDSTIDQDVSTLGSPSFVELDQSAGKIRVRDDDTSKPSGQSDGYMSVYKSGATVRLYTWVGGVRHYVNLTEEAEAGPGAGSPIGLLLALTYAA